jgi:steroid delta-isomerase-like uncharacterized protein
MEQGAALVEETTSVRKTIQEYFDAWEGTDVDRILAWYSGDVKLWLPTGLLEGKAAVRDGFVRPFVAAFPGNVHEIQRLLYADGVAVVEWRFKAEHTGDFLGIPASGRRTDVPGCSLYTLEGRVIRAGNIYFNLPTLLEQIGQEA